MDINELLRVRARLEEEKKQAVTFRDPEFSLEKWKAKVQNYKIV